MVKKAGHDVTKCQMVGMLEQKLRFFPAFKMRSIRNNEKVSWCGKDCGEIHNDMEMPSNEARAASLIGDVCMELEQRNLSYSRHSEKYLKHGMPWLSHVLGRLPQNLDYNSVLTVARFVTSIAMLQNGDFVNFQELASVIQDLPLSQVRLQSLQILSRFLLKHFWGVRVWRLHETIPHKLEVRVSAPRASKRKAEVAEVVEEPVEEVGEVSEVVKPEVIKRQFPRYLPANTSLKWSSLELGLLDGTFELPVRMGYEKYLKECHRLGVTARSFAAFKKKRLQMM
ncbi:hypothetical protein ABG768_018860 [Culter alburnus]|uniref:Uncharacterized protein n=1 Tax=Culter alburnus TaxID=194366 RepID=A0AAW2AWD0_CULAL